MKVTREELEKMIKENKDVSNVDVSGVTNMSYLFYGLDFNQDISEWDVSNVTCMNYMFEGSSFNQNISNWDVSNVKFMNCMFYGSSFNGDISKWDVSNVTDVSCMLDKYKQQVFKKKEKVTLEDLLVRIEVLEKQNISQNNFESPFGFTRSTDEYTLGLVFQGGSYELSKNKNKSEKYIIDETSGILVKTKLVPIKKELIKENDFIFMTNDKSLEDFSIRSLYGLCLKDGMEKYVYLSSNNSCCVITLEDSWNYYFKVVEVK